MTDVALEGNLAAFKLPDVLSFLAGAKKSGTLTLAGSGGAGRRSYVLFSDGALVYAGSDQEKFRLGSLLLRKRAITREQAQKIDDTIRREGGRFGEIAVSNGMLTADQVHDFLKLQVSEVVYDAFVWTDGTFQFSEELRLPDHAVTIAVDLPNLIMEGARRIEEWEHVVKLLPDDKAVFRVVASPKDDKITLTADEWKILFLVNGQRTLAELVADAEDDALNVYRIVYGILANRLIEEVARPASAEDTNRTVPVSTQDDTVRQAGGARPDPTLRETEDDTDLVVGRRGRMSWSDVVKPIVAQLTIGNGDSAGHVIPLTEAEYNVGRQRDNPVHISDPGVSGYHARIFRTTDGYAIEDLKSRNGTWINGGRIFHATLRDGDQLRIGATDLKYEVLFEPTRPR